MTVVKVKVSKYRVLNARYIKDKYTRTVLMEASDIQVNDVLLVFSPHVDDVSLTSSVTVVVKDDVTVSTVELSVCGRIHGRLVGPLDTPDLSRNKEHKEKSL